jgi:hypothetical protein
MSYVKFATAASWVDLSPYFSVPVDDIINEIKFVENMFNDERDVYQNKVMKDAGIMGIGTRLDGQKAWSALSLLSRSGDYKDILTQGVLTNENKKSYITSFRNIRDHQWTSICDYMPITTKFIKKELGKYMKLSYAKIAKLESGGDIPLHADLPEVSFDFYNTTNTYNMLNNMLIELNCPDGLEAYHDGQRLPYRKGSVIVCNQARVHGTTNNSNETRYNLRVQGLHNKNFRDLIKNNLDDINLYPKDITKLYV